MIRLTDVRTGYGTEEVLKGVNLEIDRGEMVGVLGPNGSGKTTLLLTLSGVLPVRSGRIEVDGRELAAWGPKNLARRMASVPQRLDGAFDLKVLSVVLMGRYPYISFLGGYQDQDYEIALKSMNETGTASFRDRLAGELSGGEYQRVLIARALTQETDVLLLDEAASGLDIARKVEVHDLLLDRHRRGITVISAIHDLNLAALYCTRLVFLKNGRIVLDGPAEEVFTEDHLADIYETRIKISPHPLTGAPQAHLVPGLVGRA